MARARVEEQTLVVMDTRVVSAPLGEGETALLHVPDGMYYGLDPVATRIVELLCSPMTPAQLATAVSAEFEVERETALADLLVFVRSLARRGLVRVERPGP